MKKLILACAVGFIAAATMFGGTEVARELAVNLLITGIIVGFCAIFATLLAALAIAISPSTAATIWALMPGLQTRKASPDKGELANFATINTPELPATVDYDNYDVPTYLRRGYDRGAL